MKNKMMILLAVFVTLISCKKNKDSFQIEGEYKSGTNGIVTGIKMYTKQGQLTNPETIKDFLKRKGASSTFTYNSSSISIPADLVTLTISQDNTITILANSSTTPISGEIVKRTSSELIIAQMDSIESPIPIEVNRCYSLIMATKNNNIAKKYYSLPSSTGFIGYHRFRPIIPIEIKDEQLLFPLITSLVSASSGSSFCWNSVTDEWNTFNSNILGQLQTGDTIIYQITEVPLLKQ